MGQKNMTNEIIAKLATDYAPASLADALENSEWEPIADELGLTTDETTPDESDAIGADLMADIAQVIEDACADREDEDTGEASAYRSVGITGTPEWCRAAAALLRS